MQVVDAVKRPAEGERVRLRGSNAHNQTADEAGSAGDGDPVDLGKGCFGTFERVFDGGGEQRHVTTARNFGNDAAVLGMKRVLVCCHATKVRRSRHERPRRRYRRTRFRFQATARDRISRREERACKASNRGGVDARIYGSGERISVYEVADTELAVGSTLGGPKGAIVIKASGARREILLERSRFDANSGSRDSVLGWSDRRVAHQDRWRVPHPHRSPRIRLPHRRRRDGARAALRAQSLSGWSASRSVDGLLDGRNSKRLAHAAMV